MIDGANLGDGILGWLGAARCLMRARQCKFANPNRVGYLRGESGLLPQLRVRSQRRVLGASGFDGAVRRS